MYVTHVFLNHFSVHGHMRARHIVFRNFRVPPTESLESLGTSHLTVAGKLDVGIFSRLVCCFLSFFEESYGYN